MPGLACAGGGETRAADAAVLCQLEGTQSERYILTDSIVARDGSLLLYHRLWGFSFDC